MDEVVRQNNMTFAGLTLESELYDEVPDLYLSFDLQHPQRSELPAHQGVTLAPGRLVTLAIEIRGGRREGDLDGGPPQAVSTQEEFDRVVQDMADPARIVHLIGRELRNAMNRYMWNGGNAVDNQAYDDRLQVGDRFNPKTPTGDPVSYSSHELGPKVRR